MENRDPDTAIEMTAGAACVTAGAPSTQLARATAAEPVFTAGVAP